MTRQPFDFHFCEESGSTFAADRADADDVRRRRGLRPDGLLRRRRRHGTGRHRRPQPHTARAPPRPAARPTDFDRLARAGAGKIALVQRGTCRFGVKVANAEAAGAIGADRDEPGQRRPGRQRRPVRAVRRHARRARSASRPSQCPTSRARSSPDTSGPERADPGRHDLHSRSHDRNVFAETPAGRHRQRRDGRCAPRLRAGHHRHQRQRLRSRRAARDRSKDGQGQRRRTRSGSPGGAPRSPTCRARTSTSTTSMLLSGPTSRST